jgi:hypothetical protein
MLTRKVSFALVSALLCLCVAASTASPAFSVSQLQAGTLCESGEKIVFSCSVGRAAKIASVCSSKELTKDKGYMKYRFGLPGKIELEYPKEQKLAREAFEYAHYFRALVDSTEIRFTLDGHKYSVSDDYNAEEKPVHNVQALIIERPNGTHVTLKCRGRAKAQYGDLPDAFPDHKWFLDP